MNLNYRVITNSEGANLLNGIASILIKQANTSGQITADYAIFESDEFSLPIFVKEITPQTIILLNLFRDQLDRYGEVNTIALKWTEGLKRLTTTQFIINGDDPQLNYLGSKLPTSTYYFGVSTKLMKLTIVPHDVDSNFCPNCLTVLNYRQLSYSHLGDYSCPKCQFTHPDTINYESQKINYPLFGLYNVYNTHAVITYFHQILKLPIKRINRYLKTFTPSFGRQETLIIKKRQVIIVLSKNPTGFNQSINGILGLLKNKKANFLVILNDRIPDGTDVSWIWDVDYDKIIDQANHIIISGDRTYDMNIRFVYENKKANICAIENLNQAIAKALLLTKKNQLLIILPTYSAMLETRKILVGNKFK